MEATAMLLLLMMIPAPLLVEGTSFKMDFLSSGTVRTDPLMFSQTGECLSDHVHRSFSKSRYKQSVLAGVSIQDIIPNFELVRFCHQHKTLLWKGCTFWSLFL